MIADAHCHFFSSGFLQTLAAARGSPAAGAEDLARELGWDPPGTARELAQRWTQELDCHGVRRAALIASVPGDEGSVAAAIEAEPARFVGFFMLDPATPRAAERTAAALERGLRGICLFPAMHHVPFDDERVKRIVEVAASSPGTAVFAHCGVLSVGVRKKLGLPSRFDMRLGDPLALHTLALAFPQVPFIVPHFGAGLLREALMLADVCPNVYLDTSSSNGWIRYTPGLTLDDVFRSALQVVGPRRLLFGTDSSFFPRGWQRGIYEEQRRILATLGVSAEDQALIFNGNFDRLFPENV